MSYIGTPPSNAFTSLLKQDFSTSATTGYTLDHAVNNANDIALFINFVRQEPTAGYAASGTSLVLTSATASSDDMYCVYLGQALQTVNPANASVGTAQLADDAVTKAKTSDLLYPAFEAYLSADQSISDDTWTKVNIDTEVFDSDSKFASYKFTPGVAGKYFIYASVLIETAGGHEYNLGQTGLYKNGSLFKTNRLDPEGASVLAANVPIQAVVTANDTDYFELFAYMDRTSGGTINIKTSTQSTYFGAYRIGD